MLKCNISQARTSWRALTSPQKVLKEKGIDSMLEDARKGNSDNDVEHLRRSWSSASLWIPHLHSLHRLISKQMGLVAWNTVIVSDQAMIQTTMSSQAFAVQVPLQCWLEAQSGIGRQAHWPDLLQLNAGSWKTQSFASQLLRLRVYHNVYDGLFRKSQLNLFCTNTVLPSHVHLYICKLDHSSNHAAFSDFHLLWLTWLVVFVG